MYVPDAASLELVDADGPADVLRDLIELDGRLDGLQLTVGQVCRVAGISKMKLDYWTIKARIPTEGKVQRLYELDALKTILLIKRSLASGRTLAAAIAALPVRALPSSGVDPGAQAH